MMALQRESAILQEREMAGMGNGNLREDVLRKRMMAAVRLLPGTSIASALKEKGKTSMLSALSFL
jgi:hypothetical protein